ncbi:MAG: hypothetical protein DCC65_11700 [Planctomycetota bacterium]|nr:MAG: hypothetical protein DCC65_11700 [Planctomycetota bacterium]
MRVLSNILLIASLGIWGGATSCNPQPCTPEHPDYDPVTGLCVPAGVVGADELGPPGPGTGGLPTEPGTTPPESTNVSDEQVDLAVFGLNGKWLDNGRLVCILHSGSSVEATYVEPYICDHQDGAGTTSQTSFNFSAQMTGNQLAGTTTTCVYGFDEGSGVMNGITESDMTLVVSDDGKTLSGTWYHSIDDIYVDFSLTRETVGNCRR